MITKYKNPPLVEAVCEFRFDVENPYDTILPGLLYNKIKDKFPDRKQKPLGPLMPSSLEKADIGLSFQTIAQFYDSDKTKLVQVGFDLLSINMFPPYPNWEIYKPLILDILNVYLDIAKPKGINRIGLRNINKIFIEESNVNISEYFKFYPNTPENEDVLTNYFIRVEKQLSEGRDVLVLKNAMIVENEKPGFVLDLDYIMNQPKGIDVDYVEDWLDMAHNELYQSFELCITDKLREQFNR